MSWTNQTFGPLKPGQHIGSCLRRVEAGDFTLAFWTDDGSEVKGPHSHDAAHFMLISSGHYETPARGKTPPSQPLLIFNPADTFHRDRFLHGGAFLTITVSERSWD